MAAMSIYGKTLKIQESFKAESLVNIIEDSSVYQVCSNDD